LPIMIAISPSKSPRLSFSLNRTSTVVIAYLRLRDFRHREAVRCAIQSDLDVDLSTAISANQVAQLKSAAVTRFAPHRTCCTRLRFDKTEMIE
jgi:hypothetical protein